MGRGETARILLLLLYVGKSNATRRPWSHLTASTQTEDRSRPLDNKEGEVPKAEGLPCGIHPEVMLVATLNLVGFKAS